LFFKTYVTIDFGIVTFRIPYRQSGYGIFFLIDIEGEIIEVIVYFRERERK